MELTRLTRCDFTALQLQVLSVNLFDLDVYSPAVEVADYVHQISWSTDDELAKVVIATHPIPTAHHIFTAEGWAHTHFRNHMAFRHMDASLSMDPPPSFPIDFPVFHEPYAEIALIDVWVFKNPTFTGMSQINIVQMALVDQFNEGLIKHNKWVFHGPAGAMEDAKWVSLLNEWNVQCGEVLCKKRKGPLLKVAGDRAVCWYIYIHDAWLYPKPSAPEKYQWVQELRTAADEIFNILLSWGCEVPYLAGLYLPLSLLTKYPVFKGLFDDMFFLGFPGGSVRGPRWVILNMFGEWHTPEMYHARYGTYASVWWRMPAASFITHFVVRGQLALASDGQTDCPPVAEKGEILIVPADTYVNQRNESAGALISPPITLSFAR